MSKVIESVVIASFALSRVAMATNAPTTAPTVEPIDVVVSRFFAQGDSPWSNALGNALSDTPRASDDLDSAKIQMFASDVCNPARINFRPETRRDVITKLRSSLGDGGKHNLLQAIGEGLSVRNTTACEEFVDDFVRIMFQCDKEMQKYQTAHPGEPMTLKYWLDHFTTIQSSDSNVTKNSTSYKVSWPYWVGVLVPYPQSLSDPVGPDHCIAMEARRRFDDSVLDAEVDVLVAVADIQQRLAQCPTASGQDVDYTKIIEVSTQIMTAVAKSVGAEKEHVVRKLVEFSRDPQLNWCSPHFNSAKEFIELVESIVKVLANFHRMPAIN